MVLILGRVAQDSKQSSVLSPVGGGLFAVKFAKAL
jgi:hypothetical protein